MKQTRMKSFVEQSERHYVSVPRHHLWSRIYIILRVLVFHICRVYVSVCISMCLHVCVRLYMCVSPCTTILSPFLAFSLSLISSLIFFTLASFRSRPFFPSSLTLLSLPPFRAPFTACIRAHMFFPPAFSLPLFLTFRVRSLLPLDVPIISVFHISTELNSTRNKETTRDRTKIITVSRSITRLELLVDSFHPPLCPLARASTVVLLFFFFHLLR